MTDHNAYRGGHAALPKHQGQHVAAQQRVGYTPQQAVCNAQPVSSYPQGASAHASPVGYQPVGYQPQYDAAQDVNAWSDAYQYSRATGRYTQKKPHTKRNVVIAVVVVLIVAIAGALIAYSIALNNALSKGSDPNASESLTPVQAGKPFYMLLLGSDSREGSGVSSREDESGNNQRSDVIILARVDLSKPQITLVSIPRDTPYRTTDGTLLKINELYNMGGAALTIKGVSEVTGVPISHYAEVHFSELESIVDCLGGVVVDVPTQMRWGSALTGESIALEPGVQRLDGEQAQIFARSRHQYETDQDANRQKAVRELTVAIGKAIIDRPIYEVPGKVLEVASFIGTDIQSGDLVSMAVTCAGAKDSLTIYSCSGPSDGGTNEETGLWMCYDNPEGWKKLMSVVDAGGDPSSVSF